MKHLLPYSGIAALLLGCSSLAAQPLSLERAIQSGLQFRQELQAATLQVELASKQNDKLRADWLPQVSVNGDLRYNPQLATSVIPIGQFGLPGVPADQVSQVQFGTSFVNTFALQAEQRLLAPGSRVEKEINVLQTQVEELGLEQQRIAARQRITEAYFGVLYQQERLRISAQAAQRAQVRMDEARTRQSAGAALADEVARIALEQANADLDLRKATQDRDLAYQRLFHEARIPAPGKTEIPLSDSLAVLRQQALGQTLGIQTENRPELRQALLRAETQTLSGRRAWVRRMPTVSAYGAFGYQQFSNDPNPFAADTWFPNSYIGIRASFDLFNGHKASLNNRDFSYQYRIQTLEADRLRTDLAFEVQTTNVALSQATADMETAEENLALARQLYETDLVRYRQGALTVTELRNAAFTLQSAEHNVLSALYQFLLASLNYRKATGNL